MNFCAERQAGLYRRVGLACGLDVINSSPAEADQRTIEFIALFLAGLGMNTRLSAHGLKPEQLDALVAQAVEDPCHKTNAVPVAPEDFRKLYLDLM